MRDYHIRVALRARLRDEHRGDPDTLIIEELGVRQGEVRADLAVINGSINGFEIKSGRDTLDRLPRQRDAYVECFDSTTLVIEEKHLGKLGSNVPREWGILVAAEYGDEVRFEVLRTAEPNGRVRPDVVVQFLWKDEALAALTELGVAANPRTMTRPKLWELLIASVEPDVLRRIVREKIKARGDWRAERRRARCSGSSPISASPQELQANLEWLLAQQSHDRRR